MFLLALMNEQLQPVIGRARPSIVFVYESGSCAGQTNGVRVVRLRGAALQCVRARASIDTGAAARHAGCEEGAAASSPSPSRPGSFPRAALHAAVHRVALAISAKRRIARCRDCKPAPGPLLQLLWELQVSASSIISACHATSFRTWRSTPPTSTRPQANRCRQRNTTCSASKRPTNERSHNTSTSRMRCTPDTRAI